MRRLNREWIRMPALVLLAMAACILILTLPSDGVLIAHSPWNTTPNDRTAAAPTAPATTPTREIRLHTAISEADRVMHAAILPLLEERFPGVRLIPEPLSDQEGAFLRTRAAIGALPDIFEGPQALMTSLYATSDLLPFEDRIVKLGLVERFLPDTLHLGKTQDGHICAVNLGRIHPMSFFYNRSLFKRLRLEPPTNFPAWQKTVSTLRDGGFIPLVLRAQEPWIMVQLLDMAVISSHPAGIPVQSTGLLNSTAQGLPEAFRKLDTLIRLGLLDEDARTTDTTRAVSLLRNGQAGMLFDDVSILRQTGDQIDQIAMLPFNPFSEPGAASVSHNRFSGGRSSGGFMIARLSSDPDLLARILFAYLEEKSRYESDLYGEAELLRERQPLASEDSGLSLTGRRGPIAEAGVYATLETRLHANTASLTSYAWDLPTPVRNALDPLLESLLTQSVDVETLIGKLSGQEPGQEPGQGQGPGGAHAP